MTKTTSSSETILIGENNPSSVSASCWPIRSSTQKTFSCSGEIISALPSIEFMAFMTNVILTLFQVRESITSNSGNFSLMSSMLCQYVPWLIRKSCVCTVGSALNSKALNKSLKLSDPSKSQIKAFFVTFCGQILKKASKAGTKTNVVSVSYSEPTSFQTSSNSKTST